MRGNGPESAPPLVVHIIYELGTGGLENGLINIINRAPPERYRHAIICLTTAEAFANRLSVPNIPVIPLHKKAGHDLGMYWRLWKVLRDLKPAVVHTRNLAALETQILGVFFPGTKRIHAEHGRDLNDIDGSNRKYQWFRRALNPFVHRFVAVSHDLADWLVETVGIPSRKVTHIYDGVDSSRFLPREAVAAALQIPTSSTARDTLPEGMPTAFLSSDTVVVGTVGRLAGIKNQALLLRALHLIRRNHPQTAQRVRCIIVGEGPERASLERLIAELELSACVWLAGNRDDVPACLSHFDIFTLPSLGEGVPNTILEAMATGLPVVATSVGGNPELVEHDETGLLVPSDDVNALANALLQLIEDPEQRLAMGQAALVKARETFDWHSTMNAYLQVYDELLCSNSTEEAADKA